MSACVQCGELTVPGSVSLCSKGVTMVFHESRVDFASLVPHGLFARISGVGYSSLDSSLLLPAAAYI